LKGNKILSDATKLHFSSQNKYTWIYDNQNRIIEYNSFKGLELIWTETYEYYNNGYIMIRTWYDYVGNPKHLKTEDYEYWPQIILVIKPIRKERS
jgi:hypothetical protein